MYVCMYGHTYSKSIDQPGKVADDPARGQLNRENRMFPYPLITTSMLIKCGHVVHH